MQRVSEGKTRQTVIHILIYGLSAGVLIVVLKLIEFRFLIVSHSFEIYAGLIAVVFASVGIWLGLKLTRKEEVVVLKEVPVPMPPSSQPEKATVPMPKPTPSLECAHALSEGKKSSPPI